MNNRLLLLLFTICFSTSSFASFKPLSARGSSGIMKKFGIAPGLADNFYLGDAQLNTYGINLRFTFDLTKKITFSAGYTYSLPVSQIKTTTGYSSIGGNQIAIDVPYTYRTNFHEVYIMGTRYFAGNNEKGFAFYGALGASLILAATSNDYGAVNTSTLPYSDLTSTLYMGFTLNGSLGIQFKAGPGFLFSEVRLAFPANKVNDKAVINPIPPSVGALLGYKIKFGK